MLILGYGLLVSILAVFWYGYFTYKSEYSFLVLLGVVILTAGVIEAFFSEKSHNDSTEPK
jgi:uncharacterized membrane protein HdeD (DUF308 family)